MFQDRIPLNSQLLTTQENNPLKIVLCVLRSSLLCYLELKFLHTKCEIEVPVFYSVSSNRIVVWD